jgi:hypothetical protein
MGKQHQLQIGIEVHWVRGDIDLCIIRQPLPADAAINQRNGF